jgi:hypothetical protein
MEARSKTIEAWFSMIEQGQVKLPRFQRHEAWRPVQIAGLFENILRVPSLPLGVLLVLEVGDRSFFIQGQSWGLQSSMQSRACTCSTANRE